jgi:hypothetical protein
VYREPSDPLSSGSLSSSIAIEKAGVHLAQDSPLSSEAGTTATFPLAILMASERLTDKRV